MDATGVRIKLERAKSDSKIKTEGGQTETGAGHGRTAERGEETEAQRQES